ncbi:MAG: uracil-DNA glycosylase [Campylobacteraceae bacterium]
MKTLENLKTLKELYIYKSMGYMYFKEEEKCQSEIVSSTVPNSFTLLKSTVLNCHLCSLAKSRKNIVFGEGNTNAKLMFIGEAPGASEDSMGRPFVGQAGILLTKIIENVFELKREDVYIANIIKCRPPNNRVPTLEEAEFCKPYILSQIKSINPSVIVALGSTSYHYLTGEYDTPISRVRGEVLAFQNAKLIPTFHPSYLLRNPSAKKDVYQDMLKVKGLL